MVEMKRKLLVLALGVGFLIVITWATAIPDLFPHRPTAPVQTALAGPYQITAQISPNPPPLNQPATLSLQIVRQDTQQPVHNAHITLENGMQEMNMHSEPVTAHEQPDGTYQAQLRFTMSGPWQVLVQISISGSPTEQATFEITAQ